MESCISQQSTTKTISLKIQPGTNKDWQNRAGEGNAEDNADRAGRPVGRTGFTSEITSFGAAKLPVLLPSTSRPCQTTSPPRSGWGWGRGGEEGRGERDSPLRLRSADSERPPLRGAARKQGQGAGPFLWDCGPEVPPPLPHVDRTVCAESLRSDGGERFSANERSGTKSGDE